MLKICLKFTDSCLSLRYIKRKGMPKLQILGGVEWNFASVKETNITLNSVVAIILLFHYLVSDFSGCV